MFSPRNRRAMSFVGSSDSVPLTRSRSSMGSSDQDRSARTNSGIFAPGWFNSRTGRGQRGHDTKCEGETPMFRKMILVIAAMVAVSGAVALSSSEASARWGGRGWGGGHAAFGSVGVGRVGGWGWRGAGWRGGGWGWRGAGWRGGGWGWRGVGWRGARVAGWGWRGPGWRWGWRRAGWGWGWGGLGLWGIPVAYSSCWRSVPTR